MYVLGIDGGGTKTTGVISDQWGNILAQQTVGATNPNSTKQDLIEAQFISLFRHLAEENGEAFLQVKAIFIGMAGVDRPDDQAKVKAMLTKIYQSFNSDGVVKVIVDNDAVNALCSGTLGSPGIVNIAGTGSITFGINREGKRARVGGWGYLLGDPGSGFAIGRAALQHVFAVYDGYLSKTQLYELILKHMQVDSPPQLLSNIYELGKAREVIAPLCRVVLEAADGGDEAAQSILIGAAKDMSKAIHCLRTKLFADDGEKIPVILTGGVYNRAEWFLPTLESELKESNVELMVPKVQPVAGALIAAWQGLNILVDESFIEELYKQGL